MALGLGYERIVWDELPQTSTPRPARASAGEPRRKSLLALSESRVILPAACGVSYAAFAADLEATAVFFDLTARFVLAARRPSR